MLQYSGIGDLVWHIRYFKAIAQQSRDGQVTVVAQPSTLAKAFLSNETWVAEVIIHDHRPRRSDRRQGEHAGLKGMWRMARTLKAGRFDRIVLFSGRPSRGLIAAMSGIPLRMGFGYRWLQRIFLNAPPYIPQYKGPSLAVYPEASAFMVAHGFCTEALLPRLEPPPDQIAQMRQRLGHLPRPLVAFAIGTSEAHKQWGAPKFAQLAQRLMARGCGVVLVGGPAEVKVAQEIQSLVPEADRLGLHVVTDAPVLGSAAALQVADACVGNDTGMVNVAAAVATPTFVLIGARPTLDHDELLTMLTAQKLSDISVDRVFHLLENKVIVPYTPLHSSSKK